MNKQNILLIGFNKKNLNKFQRIFETDFLIFSKIPEAKNTVKIHLVIFNRKMRDICKEVQNFNQNNQFATTPLLLFTPVNETSILQCFQNGIDDFIDENLSNELIKAKVKAYLNCKKKFKKESGKKIKIGSVTINPKKRKVSRKGKEIDLTKIEFDILNLLAQDRTKIYSRDEIYEHIWGKHIIVGERTLDVHMNNLRKKIGKNKIRTKKGIGFSINPEL
jgi:DNA-binding response OmpR family regulator